MSVASLIRTAQPARGGDTLDKGVPLARMRLGKTPRPLPLALATRASSPLKIHGTSENPEKNVGSPTLGPMESFGGVSADYSARTRTNKTRHTDSLTGNDEDSVRTVVNGDLGTSSKFQPRGRAQAAACHPLIGHVPPFSFPAC